MPQSWVPSDIRDVQTDSTVLNLTFKSRLEARRELGNCLMEYHIGNCRFLTRASDGAAITEMAVPDETCDTFSSNVIGQYRRTLDPNEPLTANMILPYSIAKMVDEIVIPLLDGGAGDRNEQALSIARAMLQNERLSVDGKIRYGSQFHGDIRLTDEGRRRIQEAIARKDRAGPDRPRDARIDIGAQQDQFSHLFEITLPNGVTQSLVQ